MSRNHKLDCQCGVCKAKRGETKGRIHKLDCQCCYCRSKRGETKGISRSEATKKKISTTLKGRYIGEKNPMYGKSHSKKTKQKMRESHLGISSGKKGKHLSKKVKERLREVNLGKHHTEKTKKKMRKAQIKLWQNPEFKEKTIKAIIRGSRIKPNKSEKRFNKILQQLFLNEYKYVGDGTVLIGYKNPDFININNQKKIIELFGDYWHGKERTDRIKIEEENQRINHFAKYGYRTLIVWEHELEDIDKLKMKLLSFAKEKIDGGRNRSRTPRSNCLYKR